MALSLTNRDTREWLTDRSQMWRLWRALSNELGTPKILFCPDDRERRPAAAWSGLTNNSHLSYFLGLNASEEQPESILAGDRNLTTNGVAVGPGRLVIAKDYVLGWTEAIHNQDGNFLFGDGSVQQGINGRLREAWREGTNVWLVP